jgi:hypothetical protein
MVWSQEPHRVRRLSSIPVYLVVENEPDRQGIVGRFERR